MYLSLLNTTERHVVDAEQNYSMWHNLLKLILCFASVLFLLNKSPSLTSR